MYTTLKCGAKEERGVSPSAKLIGSVTEQLTSLQLRGWGLVLKERKPWFFSWSWCSVMVMQGVHCGQQFHMNTSIRKRDQNAHKRKQERKREMIWLLAQLRWSSLIGKGAYIHDSCLYEAPVSMIGKDQNEWMLAPLLCWRYEMWICQGKLKRMVSVTMKQS